MTKLDELASDVAPAEPETPELAAGRRRFVVAVVIGQILVGLPYLWVISTTWGHTNFFRKTNYEDNFYDLQARAMFHGHLWVANGSLGIEGWIHGGREYTYFGLFPSIIRMPILLFTSAADSKLTAMSILVSWVATGVFCSLLLWRLRVVVRGAVALGWAEAVSCGALVATVVGGSVLVYLAAVPYVFNEDLAWSVALTIASLFALLGVLEAPTKWRVLGAGVLVFCANMDRTTTGWACAAAAVLIALWLRSGRGGDDKRGWFVPVLLVGLIPFAANCAVDFLKFGTPIGLPVTDQVWSHVNAHRQYFLKVNHNSEVGAVFAPADALAYLRPDGIRFTSVFPYVGLPSLPPPSMFGVVFDRRYRTASVTDSMPLLFLLSCWGMVAAFRRQPRGGASLTRLLLICSAGAGGALLLWGYIANRYLADFVPFLALASMVGLVDLWRRAARRARGRATSPRPPHEPASADNSEVEAPSNSRSTRGPRRYGYMLAAVVVLGTMISVVFNFAIAVAPNSEWSSIQTLRFVKAQKLISDVTGHPITSSVRTGSALPELAPANELYIVGQCEGLYISTGEDVSSVPTQEYQRQTWMNVQEGPAFEHTVKITFGHAQAKGAPPIGLVRAGQSTIYFTTSKTSLPGYLFVAFGEQDPRFSIASLSEVVAVGSTHSVTIVTDTATHFAQVVMNNIALLSNPMVGGSPGVVIAPQTSTASPGYRILNTTPANSPPLCRSLLGR